MSIASADNATPSQVEATRVIPAQPLSAAEPSHGPEGREQPIEVVERPRRRRGRIVAVVIGAILIVGAAFGGGYWAGASNVPAAATGQFGPGGQLGTPPGGGQGFGPGGGQFPGGTAPDGTTQGGTTDGSTTDGSTTDGSTADGSTT